MCSRRGEQTNGEATYTWRSAKIDEDLALLKEAIFLVELDKLKGSSGSVALLLGQLIPFVETALAVLLLDGHFRRATSKLSTDVEVEIAGLSAGAGWPMIRNWRCCSGLRVLAVTLHPATCSRNFFLSTLWLSMPIRKAVAAITGKYRVSGREREWGQS